MVSNQKPSGRAASIPAGLTFGVIVSVSITLLGALLLGKLIDMEKIQWDNVGHGIIILLLIASYLGSMTACTKIRRQRLIVCILSGVAYFGILLSMTALFFGGQYEAVGVTAALIIAGSGSAGLLGTGKKAGMKRTKRGRTYR